MMKLLRKAFKKKSVIDMSESELYAYFGSMGISPGYIKCMKKLRVN